MPNETELRVILLDKIIVEDRFRVEMGLLQELADAIREKGVLQPITVDAPTTDGHYRLIAGARRVRAANMAGLDSIPALVRKSEDIVDARECELMENVNRKDMTWQEHTRLTDEINRLYHEKTGGDWSERKTAHILNRSHEGVRRQLRLAEAIRIVPALASCKTEDDAFKALRGMEEEAIIKIARGKQLADPGISDAVRHASSHYRLGDCRAGMKEIENETVVSLIEVDPPYGISLDEVKRRKDEGSKDLDSYNEISPSAYPAFIREIANETYRVAGRNCWMIFWFGPTWHTMVKEALIEARWKVDYIPAIWIKPTGQTNQPELYLARSYEPFFICSKGSPILCKRGRNNVFDYTPVAPQRKYHPTQRPMELMQELLETFALPGSVIMVPFLGSGVALLAAYKLRMTGFGWDLDKDVRDRFLVEVQRQEEEVDGTSDSA